MAGNKGSGSIELYKDDENKFAWRVKSSNGQVLAVSAKSYSSKQMCVKGFTSFAEKVNLKTPIVDLTGE